MGPTDMADSSVTSVRRFRFVSGPLLELIDDLGDHVLFLGSSSSTSQEHLAEDRGDYGRLDHDEKQCRRTVIGFQSKISVIY